MYVYMYIYIYIYMYIYIYVYIYIHMCEMNHSHVSQAHITRMMRCPCTRVLSLEHTCDMTHSHVRYDSLVSWCDIVHLYV